MVGLVIFYALGLVVALGFLIWMTKTRSGRKWLASL